MQQEKKDDNIINLSKRKRKYIAFINDETGEVEAFCSPIVKQKKGLGGNWVAFFQEALEWLAKQNLPNEQYRVLMHLMSKLDFENYLRVTQSDIAKSLGMQRTNVSRAIKGLITIDVIAEGPKVGNAKTYRLNPRMAHKGKNISNTIVEYSDLKKLQKQK